MARYMIEASHTPEDCVRVLDLYLRAGAHYLTHAEWGCEDGVHTAWIIVDAETPDEARLRVPPVIRNTASLVKLCKFAPEQIRAFHEMAEAGWESEK
ncbi:MAG TPA: hypothetical protein VNL15_04030 [Dehalococcoidia bacterium]|nr:hypothetical protein [Dehalococcoidia bacterium]